jgi:hypothetical protein
MLRVHWGGGRGGKDAEAFMSKSATFFGSDLLLRCLARKLHLLVPSYCSPNSCSLWPYFSITLLLSHSLSSSLLPSSSVSFSLSISLSLSSSLFLHLSFSFSLSLSLSLFLHLLFFFPFFILYFLYIFLSLSL